VTLVKTKQDCLKKLLKTVRTTRRISELVISGSELQIQYTLKHELIKT